MLTDGPIGREFDSPHLQKSATGVPPRWLIFCMVGTESRNGASGKSRAGAGSCSVGVFWRTSGSQKRLSPPPYCRSVFATIVQNRTTFLLFAVYKQVTETQNLRNLISIHVLHDSQEPFQTTSVTARNYPSEKCFNIPRDV